MPYLPLGLFLLACGGAAATNEPAESVTTASSRFWRSVGFLELTCEEYFAGPNDEPAPGTVGTIHHLLLGIDGESAVRSTVRERDGTKRVSERRQTGELEHRLVHGSNGELAEAWTTRREDGATSYANDVFSVIWLLMPAMEHLDELIEAGATCEWLEGSDEKVAVVHASFRGSPVMIECDATRDFAIRRVRVGEKEGREFIVEEFEDLEGHWFPAKGRMGTVGESEKEWMRFRVSDIHINRPIDPSRFALPDLPNGVLYTNDIKQTREVIGGVASMTRPSNGPPVPVRSARAVEVASTMDRTWVVSLVIASVVVVVLAFVWRRFREK